MKIKSIIILLTAILISCSNSSTSETKTTKSIGKVTQSESEKEESDIVEEKDDDCVFDLNTQNSDFLNGIKPFENIIWIDSIQTGFISQENGDTIEINRGGCVHYNNYVTIHSYSDTTTIENIDYWKSKILEIGSLLPNFESEMVDSLLTNKLYELESTTNQQYFTLHQDLYCSMTFVIEKRKNGEIIIDLGYYLC